MLLLGTSILSTSILAQPPSGARQRSLVLAREAAQAYAEGDPDRAVELLEAAHDAHPEPILRYNLARAHESAGRVSAAIEAYEAYLDAAGEISNRAALEQHVRTLRARLARERHLALARESAEARAQASEDAAREAEKQSNPWPWVTSGTGLAALSGGLTLGVLARNERSNVDDAPSHLDASTSFHRAQDLALGANVLLSVGAALLVSGVIWLIVRMNQ